MKVTRNESRGVNRKQPGADLLRYGETKQRAILEGVGRVKGFSKKDKKIDRWLLLSARHIFYYKCKDSKQPDDSAVPVGIFDIFDIEHPKDVVPVPETAKKKHKLEKSESKDKHTKNKSSAPSSKESAFPFQFPLLLETDSKVIVIISVRAADVRKNWINRIREQLYILFDNSQEGTAPLPDISLVVNEHDWYKNPHTFLDERLYTSSAASSTGSGTPTGTTRKLPKRTANAEVQKTGEYVQTLREQVNEGPILLQKLIHEISVGNDIEEVKQLVSDQLKSSPTSSQTRDAVEALLLKCKLPDQMVRVLDIKSKSLTEYELLPPFLDLVEELKNIHFVIDKPTFQALSPYFTQMQKYYSEVIDNVKSYGSMGIKRNVTLHGVGANLGHRILHNWAAARIVTGSRENEYGTHTVRFFHNIHWKRNPDQYGYEYASDCLFKLISGQELSAPVQLVKITDHEGLGSCYQASLSVDGVLLAKLLTEKPELLAHLDTENYTNLFLLSILINSCDGKADNIIAKYNEKTRKIELVFIDNDQVFADPLIQIGEEVSANLRNFIFFLPHAKQRLDAKAKSNFMQHSPELLILMWLEHLFVKNQEYEALLEQGIFGPEDYAILNLPLKVRHREVINLYSRLVFLYSTIIADEADAITHNDILKAMQPVVYEVIQELLREPRSSSASSSTVTSNTNTPSQSIDATSTSASSSTRASTDHVGLRAFERFFVNPTIQGDPVLRPLLTKVIKVADVGELQLGAYLKSRRFPKVWDFAEKRTVSVVGAIEEFLGYVDFSQLQLQVSKGRAERYFIKHVLPLIPFTNFVLRGSDLFADDDLHTLMKTSRYLKTVQFIRCNSITTASLKQFLNTKIEITINGCCGLIPKCNGDTLSPRADAFLKQLHSLQFVEDDPTDVNGSRSEYSQHQQQQEASFSDKIVPHELNKPIGLLEDGLLEQAALSFFDAEALEPGIIEKYKAIIIKYTNLYASLTSAIQRSCHRAVQFFVQNLGFDINAWNLLGLTPLQVSAKYDNIEMSLLLINLGADVNRAGIRSITAIQQALVHKNEKLVQVLVEKGAELNITYESGWNLLHLALSRNLVASAKLLLSKGINYAAVTSNNENMLHFAAENVKEDTQLIEMLLGFSLDLRAKTNDRANTPILLAAAANNIAFMTKAIEKETTLKVLSNKLRLNLGLDLRLVDRSSHESESMSPPHSPQGGNPFRFGDWKRRSQQTIRGSNSDRPASNSRETGTAGFFGTNARALAGADRPGSQKPTVNSILNPLAASVSTPPLSSSSDIISSKEHSTASPPLSPHGSNLSSSSQAIPNSGPVTGNFGIGTPSHSAHSTPRHPSSPRTSSPRTTNRKSSPRRREETFGGMNIISNYSPSQSNSNANSGSLTSSQPMTSPRNTNATSPSPPSISPTSSNPRSMSIRSSGWQISNQPSSPNRSRPNSPGSELSDFLVGSVGAEEGIDESSNHFIPSSPSQPSPISNPSPGGFQFATSGHAKSRQTAGRIGVRQNQVPVQVPVDVFAEPLKPDAKSEPIDVSSPQSQAFVHSLTTAAWKGDTPEVERLLQTRPALVNATNSRGQSALYSAVRNQHLTTVLVLLAIPGIDVNSFVPQHGGTCLHAACFTKNLPVLAALLVCGADKTRKNEEGLTALEDNPLPEIEEVFRWSEDGPSELVKRFPDLLKCVRIQQEILQEGSRRREEQPNDSLARAGSGLTSSHASSNPSLFSSKEKWATFPSDCPKLTPSAVEKLGLDVVVPNMICIIFPTLERKTSHIVAGQTVLTFLKSVKYKMRPINPDAVRLRDKNFQPISYDALIESVTDRIVIIEEDTDSVLTGVNNQGETILHLLVSNKYYIANHLELLFNSPLKTYVFDILEVKDVNGRTPLLRACAEGNFDAIRLLLMYNANATAEDYEGESCLHHVVESDRPETFNCVEILLRHPDCGINKYNSKGYTPLAKNILLMFKNSTVRSRIVERLLEHGESLDNCVRNGKIAWDCCKIEGVRPFEFVFGREKSVLERVDANNETLLHVATRYGNVEILKKLLCHLKQLPETKSLAVFRQLSVPLRNNLLHAACYMVCMCNHVTLVTELIRAHSPVVLIAMINEQNANGETPLDLAIKENLLQTTAMMKLVLSSKATLLANATSSNGQRDSV